MFGIWETLRELMLFHELRGISESISGLNNQYSEVLLVLLGAVISMLTTFSVDYLKEYKKSKNFKEYQINVLENCIAILKDIQSPPVAYKVKQVASFVEKQIDKLIEEKTSDRLTTVLFRAKTRLDDIIIEMNAISYLERDMSVMPIIIPEKDFEILNEIVMELKSEINRIKYNR